MWLLGNAIVRLVGVVHYVTYNDATQYAKTVVSRFETVEREKIAHVLLQYVQVYVLDQIIVLVTVLLGLAADVLFVRIFIKQY